MIIYYLSFLYLNRIRSILNDSKYFRDSIAESKTKVDIKEL